MSVILVLTLFISIMFSWAKIVSLINAKAKGNEVLLEAIEKAKKIRGTPLYCVRVAHVIAIAVGATASLGLGVIALGLFGIRIYLEEKIYEQYT